jgi:hypothetical protein
MPIHLSDHTTTRIAQHLAAGTYKSPEAVVDAALDALDLIRADAEHIRNLIAEADDDIAAGRTTRYASADELVADIIARGDARLNRDTWKSRPAHAKTSTPSSTIWQALPVPKSPDVSRARSATTSPTWHKPERPVQTRIPSAPASALPCTALTSCSLT